MRTKVAMKTNLVVRKIKQKRKYGDIVKTTGALLTLTAPTDKDGVMPQDLRLLEALRKAFDAEFTTLKIDRFNHVQISKEF